jgi:predicted dehydrogenase/nucleoside-diphosphate-sugar epimerase
MIERVQETTGSGVDMRPVRLAIVGGGAVTERLHLPALAGSTMVEVAVLVDPNPARRTLLGQLYPGLHVAESIEGIEQHAEAALVAVPHHLHRDIATTLLERGLHVLVEKPLAVSLQDADVMIAAAKRTGRRLSVGLIRRQYHSFEFVRRVIDAGWLGPLRSFDWREGGVYGWPVASPALFRKDSGGGVLLDTGAHSVDTLLAWLGPFETVEYVDDERGGVDANCLLTLRLRGGLTGQLELSRTRELRNTCMITGEKGELEVGFAPHSPVTLRTGTLSIEGPIAEGGRRPPGVHACDRRQIEAFARAIRTADEPPVSAESARESVRLFDECRRVRQPWALPWEAFDSDVDLAAFRGARVLVLGGTGFLGGRLAEVLARDANAQVRILARDLSRLAAPARYDMDIVHGEVSDPDILGRAMEGCTYVFNCTYGKGPAAEQARVNVEAVRTLVAAAARCGVRRLVHTSTVSVYGTVLEGRLHEALGARASKADTYGFTKLKGEELLLSEGPRAGLEVVAVQPTTIYGPGAPSWTVSPIRMLKSGRVVLVDGGRGIANAVYVDDVVTALLRAALAPAAAGERVLVSGPDVVTWKEFYGAYCRMLGADNVVEMNATEIAAARRHQRKGQGNIARLRAILKEEYQGNPRLIELPALVAIRNLVRGLVPRTYIEGMKRQVMPAPAPLPEPSASPAFPAHLPTPEQEAFYRAAATADIAKAGRVLGYRPTVPFDRGMARVAQWAAWANLL